MDGWRVQRKTVAIYQKYSFLKLDATSSDFNNSLLLLRMEKLQQKEMN